MLSLSLSLSHTHTHTYVQQAYKHRVWIFLSVIYQVQFKSHSSFVCLSQYCAPQCCHFPWTYTITFIHQLSLHKARSVNAHRQSVFVHYCACYFVSLQCAERILTTSVVVGFKRARSKVIFVLVTSVWYKAQT